VTTGVQLCAWQVIGTPSFVTPVAPAGAQNDPAVTYCEVAGVVVGATGGGVVGATVGVVVAMVGGLVVTAAVVEG
jgi:hypothetical protein